MSVADTTLVGSDKNSEPTSAAPSKRRRGNWSVFWLLLPAAILILGIFSYPLLVAVWRSFAYPQIGIQNYAWFFGNEGNLAILGRTLLIALATTLICLVLSFPYAYLMTISSTKVRNLLMILVMVPFWTSLMIRTFAWIILLQDNGIVNQLIRALGLEPVQLMRNPTGVLIGMVQVLLPFMVLPLYNAMASIDMRLLQAGQSLGAKPSVAFFKIFVPLAVPGVISGSLLVFIQALGFYITPALLGSPTEMLISQYIYAQVSGQLQWGRGSVLGVVLLVSVLIILLLMVLVGRLAKGVSAPSVVGAGVEAADTAQAQSANAGKAPGAGGGAA